MSWVTNMCAAGGTGGGTWAAELKDKGSGGGADGHGRAAPPPGGVAGPTSPSKVRIILNMK